MSEGAHHHHHDFASANQALFDEHAHKAEHRPHAPELAESVSNAILQAYPFDKDTTTVLDYACGTGIVSRRLAPHCKTLLGVDISQGMVDEFNKGVQSHSLNTEQIRALRAELKGEDTELDGMKFDIIICSLAYHHFGDIAAVTTLLTFFLKPGGTLLVADFPTMDPTALPVGFEHVVAHSHGISEAAIKGVYEGAGLQGFHQVLFKGPKTDLHPEVIFLAKGIKPC
ncbi:S-adenosyl-L-methionine-dependent methyltransferase [Mycena crocata]|nr:S-adenosyl-L-methionine-dependent methyltransferase [Mycena crocata]